MTISSSALDQVSIRLARDDDEIRAAQHLRYKVFYEEFGARPSPEISAQQRDFDDFDTVADHLVVVDERIPDPHQRIVGTYRLLRREVADRFGRFYTSSEYDIGPLLASGKTLLELGRSCVLAPYRTRPVLQLLWQGIYDYMLDHKIDLMFGCASFHGTEVKPLASQLAYLYHYHISPPGLRPRTLPQYYLDMNQAPKDSFDPQKVFAELPPLIKGYLRLGAGIGDGAYVDHQFNTIDVCIVLEMSKLSERYVKFYERKVNRAMAGQDADIEDQRA